jgi:hypothetical protein
LGADVVFPLSTSSHDLGEAYFAVGAEIKVAAIFKFDAGFSGNNQVGWNVPFGITLGPLGPLEFGLATGDVLTFISKSKNPNISIAVAVLRINIDPKLGIGAKTPPTPGI